MRGNMSRAGDTARAGLCLWLPLAPWCYTRLAGLVEQLRANLHISRAFGNPYSAFLITACIMSCT